MAKIKSFGAKVYVNGVAIGGLTDINASGTDVTMIDTTSHDSSGGYREFLSGLKDGGTLELTGKYNYADAGQVELKSEEGVTHAVYILLSDNSGLAFNAIIGGFQTTNPLDDAVEFTASAKITGIVYPVFPTMVLSGTLTSDGSTAEPVGSLPMDGMDNGRPQYGTVSIGYLAYDGDSWVYTSTAGSIANATGNTLTPSLATGWTFDPPATGTPVFTGS